jgi:biotin carboxyl carrier protein
MQYEVDVNGRSTSVTVTRRDGRFVVAVGERRWTVDAAAIGTHTMSLLLEHDASPGVVESREMSLARDAVTDQIVVGLGATPIGVRLESRRRWARKDDAHTTGPQRIVAPMPGKIVRVLARVGDAVVHRQPIVVIEAMKMENELRAARDGVVTDVLVREGQSVDAGTPLAVITPP